MSTDWLNGPELVAWIEDQGVTPAESKVGSNARVVRHWRRGSKAGVFTVDRVLTKMGLCLFGARGDVRTGASVGQT